MIIGIVNNAIYYAGMSIFDSSTRSHRGNGRVGKKAEKAKRAGMRGGQGERVWTTIIIVKTEYPSFGVARYWNEGNSPDAILVHIERPAAIVFVIIKNAIRNSKLENGRAVWGGAGARASCLWAVHWFLLRKLMTVLPILLSMYEFETMCVYNTAFVHAVHNFFRLLQPSDQLDVLSLLLYTFSYKNLCFSNQKLLLSRTQNTNCVEN